jgi:hypothetical protein
MPSTTTPSPTAPPTSLPTAANFAAVVVEVAGGGSLAAAEGGAPGSFTVRLSAPPLSPVVVELSVAPDVASVSPARVAFDHDNYSAPVACAVVGRDDDVDQGDGQAGNVVFAVWSADDASACERSGRGRGPGSLCARAAAYGALDPAPLALFVADDDSAGVRLSARGGGGSALNATFDNYGEPLGQADYTLRLNSRPTAAVEVTVAGLGPFSTASPAQVRIEPNDWASPVTVRVSAGAPTLQRPACASGGRFCAEVAAACSQAAILLLFFPSQLYQHALDQQTR